MSSAALVFRAEQAETLRRMEEASNYTAWLLDRARPYLGRRVLDVGAGIGTFSAEIAQGRTVVALEPDPAFVPRLRARFAGSDEVEVVAGYLDALGKTAEDGRFDTAICFNVLEHIADDAGALRRLLELLEPGGVLLALVPAHPAAYGSLDSVLGHERRYRRRGLERALRGAGFEVERLRYVNPVGLIGWLVTARVLRAPQIPSAPLRVFDRLVAPLRLLDRAPLPFGLSLWAVARRPR